MGDKPSSKSHHDIKKNTRFDIKKDVSLDIKNDTSSDIKKDTNLNIKKDISLDINKDIKVLRTSRNLPPADFVFKIQSFSTLLGWSTTIQSRSFESGGYKWRLSAKVNNKKDGGNYISLYLSVADPNNLSSGWEVHVDVKFFLFNQIKNKYLPVQDGKIWHFHDLRTEWGIEELLPLSIFNDSSNGYLVDDFCVFGAEIAIKNPNNNATFELFDLPKTRKTLTFIWKIKNYSMHETKTTLFSPEFIIGGWKWKLLFYPKGHYSDGSQDIKHISLFLKGIDQSEWKATFKLRIVDQVSGGCKERETTSKFSLGPYTTSWGFTEFMTLKYLKDKANNFIHDDSLLVEVEFSYLSVIRMV